MIRTYLYNKNETKVISELDIQKVKWYLKEENINEGSLLWVDLYDTSLTELHIVGDLFNFHPLTLEDCLQHTLRSKVDKYDNYTFFVFNAINYNEVKDEEITTQELNIFLGENFIVTVHPKRIKAIGRIVSRVQYSTVTMEKGPDYLLYCLLDEIVDEYFPILDRISERIDELEDEMYVNPAQEISEEFLALKRTIVLIRRVIQPKKRIFANVGSRYMC